jgi:hypothetical protein
MKKLLLIFINLYLLNSQLTVVKYSEDSVKIPTLYNIYNFTYPLSFKVNTTCCCTTCNFYFLNLVNSKSFLNGSKFSSLCSYSSTSTTRLQTFNCEIFDLPEYVYLGKYIFNSKLLHQQQRIKR